MEEKAKLYLAGTHTQEDIDSIIARFCLLLGRDLQFQVEIGRAHV